MESQLELLNLVNSNYSTFNPFEAYISIPYRGREEQLERFISHISNYMNIIHPTIKYKIVILEQNNKHPFNRGKLLNSGFLECEKLNTETKYI